PNNTSNDTSPSTHRPAPANKGAKNQPRRRLRRRARGGAPERARTTGDPNSTGEAATLHTHRPAPANEGGKFSLAGV
ncbi:hypothetical protein, partial [Streptomyces sp. CAU 1734]|uniref:hypothetical protein n=1 Tax=Streptomyces sp. CAU 1734 TaxID=3140360 RepID=UPI003261A07B